MDEERKALVCRRCDRAAVQVRTEDGGDLARCPVCGREGDLNEAIGRAQIYLARSIQNSEIDRHQRRLIAVTKHSQNVTYRPGKLPALIPPDFIFR